MTFDIRKIAHLARISVTPEEEQIIRPRLAGIMHLLDQLQSIDTEGIEPMVTPLLDHFQRERPDTATESDHHILYQECAPKVAANLYLVPQVIE